MEGPNWVGHLITKYSEPSDEANRKDRGSSIIVFDYALGGQTVSGVKNQIERPVHSASRDSEQTRLDCRRYSLW